MTPLWGWGTDIRFSGKVGIAKAEHRVLYTVVSLASAAVGSTLCEGHCVALGKAGVCWWRFRAVACRMLTETFSFRLLNNNQIKSIPGGAFEDLENLKYL